MNHNQPDKSKDDGSQSEGGQSKPSPTDGGSAGSAKAPLSANISGSLPEVYYEGATKDYYRVDSRHGYIRIDKQSLKTYLRSLGYSARIDEGARISELDEVILAIQANHNVDYVAPLAGWKAGFYRIGKLHVLVTESPNRVIPSSGQWPLIKHVGENLFGPIQWPYVLSWLKLSLAMMHTGCWQAGQAFVMCGPKGAGKNLFMQIILTLLGGRAADPYQFMTGRTSFNHDMFGGELLLIEDKAESTNIQARRSFGAQIKNITVNEYQRHHRKYGDAHLLRPYWRIGISLNDDAERLLVLPPIDPDIDDKIMLFKVFKHPMPMSTRTGALKKQFEDAWKAEIPAFAHHLLHEWEIPAELQCDRFGVEAYANPELLATLEETTPQDRLLELIDKIIFGTARSETEWHGRPSDLEHELKCKADAYAKEVERLLTHSNAFGAYMGRLLRSRPLRIAKRTLDGRTIWTVRRDGPALSVFKSKANTPEFARIREKLKAAKLKMPPDEAASA